MPEDSIYIQFGEPWFHDPDSVDELLERLDMGESIPIKSLQEACKKEGKTLKIEIR